MNESVIQPGMFKLPGLTKEIIIFFNLQHFMMFHKRVDGSRIKSFGPARRYQWEGRSGLMTALGGMIGAPLAVMIAEMAMVSGTEKIYAFGSAGSTGAEKFKIGEAVVPGITYDETGICRDYEQPESYQPLSSFFDVRRCRAIVSVNSFFRLTRPNLERYRTSNIQLIDMEAAPLNCVLNQRNKRFQPLFVVSDQVSDSLEWQNGGGSDAFRQGLEIGLDLMAKI